MRNLCPSLVVCMVLISVHVSDHVM